MQEFKHHYTEGPNISLRTIHIFNQTLWRHVNGRADINILEFRPNSNNGLLDEFGKPEVCDFGLPVVQENVCDLEVPMDDVLVCQVFEALVDVLDDGNGLLLSKVLVHPQLAFQVPLIAQFSYDITISVARKHFITT